MSAPSLYNFIAASAVAIFPTQIGFFKFIFLIFDRIFITLALCPWAVSMTIKSTPASIIDLVRLKSSFPVPTAAPTNRFFFLLF